MTSIEAYKKFLLKVNKNDTNSNIRVSKGEFVLLFNEERLKWLNDDIFRDESSEKIDQIKELLVVDNTLQKIEDKPFSSTFALPNNFYQEVGSYCIAEKGECKEAIIINWFKKPKDINVLLQNSNERPSFEWRETIAVVTGSLLLIYKRAFGINQAYLTYYKQPDPIDLTGYIHIDGTPSINLNSDLTDDNMAIVIDRVVTQVLGNYDNVEQWQIAAEKQKADEQDR